MSTDMLCAASMSLYTVDYSRGNAYYRLTNGLHVNFLTNPRSVTSSMDVYYQGYLLTVYNIKGTYVYEPAVKLLSNLTALQLELDHANSMLHNTINDMLMPSGLIHKP